MEEALQVQLLYEYGYVENTSAYSGAFQFLSQADWYKNLPDINMGIYDNIKRTIACMP